MYQDLHGGSMDRVKFYSAADLSISLYLPKASNMLNAYQKISFVSINDVLEYYNIVQFVDAGIFQAECSEVEIKQLRAVARGIKEDLWKYMDKLNSFDMAHLLDEVDIEYVEDYWELVDKMKSYQKLSKPDLHSMLKHSTSAWFRILTCSNIIKYFGDVFRDCMMQSTKVAECLINKYLIYNQESANRIHLPKELTSQDMLKIVNSYINSEDVNPNYLNVLMDAQPTKSFPIDDKTKLKAKKAYERELHYLLKDGNLTRWPMEYKVSFTKNPKGLSTQTISPSSIHIEYSREWLIENPEFPTLLNNFIYLFEYVDLQMRSILVSKPQELGVFEKYAQARPCNHYLDGAGFKCKNLLAILQLAAYCDELGKIGINLETVIEWFFAVYLLEAFCIDNYRIRMPSKTSSALDKCKSILSEMERVLKQFQCYVAEGNIEHELLSISSKPLVFSNIGSLILNKYAYIKSEKIAGIMRLVFSDQSPLAYLPHDNGAFQCFAEHVLNESINRESFSSMYTHLIDYLVSESCFAVSVDGSIYVSDFECLEVLEDLYHNEVISYWRNPPRRRVALDKLIKTGDVIFESALFTRPEQDYLNYMLNKSTFSNGYDLRNSYMHGTYAAHEGSESMHETNYLKLLVILVLYIIKINDEFCLRVASNDQGKVNPTLKNKEMEFD
jgi:hypothetical protein